MPWKCNICGYMHYGDEPPKICPMCGASGDDFTEVLEEFNEDETMDKEIAEDIDAELDERSEEDQLE